jgi:plastocyanin
MNSKIIIGIIIVVIVIGGGIYFFSKNNSSQMKMPTQSQGQNVNPTSSDQTPTTTNAVTIQNYAFSPATITVKVGDTVTWMNNDSTAHSATADDGSFDTGLFSPGQSKSFTFKKAGTYTYHCSAHPYMKGTVIVK